MTRHTHCSPTIANVGPFTRGWFWLYLSHHYLQGARRPGLLVSDLTTQLFCVTIVRDCLLPTPMCDSTIPRLESVVGVVDASIFLKRTECKRQRE